MNKRIQLSNNLDVCVLECDSMIAFSLYIENNKLRIANGNLSKTDIKSVLSYMIDDATLDTLPRIVE